MSSAESQVRPGLEKSTGHFLSSFFVLVQLADTSKGVASPFGTGLREVSLRFVLIWILLRRHCAGLGHVGLNAASDMPIVY